MIQLLKATTEDIIEVAASAVDSDNIDRADEVRRRAEIYIANGPSYKAVYEGRLVAVAGVMMVRPGVGHIWFILSDKEKSFGFVRQALIMMKEMVAKLIADLQLTKLRTTSRIGFVASQSLLEHLGFVRKRRLYMGRYYLYTRT